MLFLDGVGRALVGRTREALGACPGRLSVHRRPAYAAELNPADGLYAQLKDRFLRGYCRRTSLPCRPAEGHSPRWAAHPMAAKPHPRLLSPHASLFLTCRQPIYRDLSPRAYSRVACRPVPFGRGRAGRRRRYRPHAVNNRTGGIGPVHGVSLIYTASAVVAASIVNVIPFCPAGCAAPFTNHCEKMYPAGPVSGA